MALVFLSFIPGWSSLGFCPDFFVMMLYLWLVYRPDLIQFPGLVIIGLIQDGLYGYPLGISIFEIMLLFLSTQFLRRFILQRSFGFIFAGYVAYLFTYSSIKWFILSCFKHEWLSLLLSLFIQLFAS
jgi:cell shape-determining protein MreD